MKLLDSTYSHEFIKALFEELSDGNYIDTNSILNSFNVFKKQRIL